MADENRDLSRIFMLEVQHRGLQQELEMIKGVMQGIAQGEQARLDEIRRHAGQIDAINGRLASIENRFAEMSFKCNDMSVHFEALGEQIGKLNVLVTTLTSKMEIAEKAAETKKEIDAEKKSYRLAVKLGLLGVIGGLLSGIIPVFGQFIDWAKNLWK
ncbi:MAG: hypothetical protein HQL80_06580 [Magnetococcales bacterium]|nr:hypothetical protein [Magnetococcales bacterium]